MNTVRRAIPLGFLWVLILLFFYKFILTDLILARGDVYLYFYPYWEAASDALREGRLPLWNPHIFMGAPLLANSQMGFFYPLNWPLWLLLEVPYALGASIVIHGLIGGGGSYALARRWGNGRWGSWLSGALFILGGYFSAQVEHINQIQGLAWLPWLLWALTPPEETQPPHRLRPAAWIALFFTLQLLAGHTQTVFISGVAAGVWIVCGQWGAWRRLNGRLLLLAGGGLLALLMAGAQLLPTLELAGLSSREGGLSLNEVLSFSLNPLLLGRSLLPGYGESLFTEYVAYLPLGGWLLAVLGGWRWRQDRRLWPAIALVLVGFVLALGRFGLLYLLLGRLPGFDLFRVPARWLVVAMLGLSLLAGQGFAQLRLIDALRWERLKRPLLVGLGLLAALMVWSVAALPLGGWIPVGPESPLSRPGLPTLLGWGIELLLLAGFGWVWLRQRKLWGLQGVLGVLVLSLFLASRALPYTNLTTPEAYFDLRPPIARLQAETADSLVAPRFLSLSNIFFDPGDQAEIDTIYGKLLPLPAQYDYTVAIKHKEIIAPNLPMVYGLHALDGFDGGILPLRSYSGLLARTILAGETTTDGRLREYLPQVPENRWLNRFGVGYIITDKTGDVWEDGIYFDLEHAVVLDMGQTIAAAHLPPMLASAIQLYTPTAGGELLVTIEGGSQLRLPLEPQGETRQVAELPQPSRLTAVELISQQDGWGVGGLTLVDASSDTFIPLTLGNYRMIYSAEVKIYANQAVFEPLLLLPSGSNSLASDVGTLGEVELLRVAPERWEITAALDNPARLVVLEAAYPGWEVRVNGEAAPLVLVEEFFRGVDLPAGEHQIEMLFVPASVRTGRWLSLLGWLMWVGGVLWGWRRENP